jgi:hypothetical protein
MIDHPPLWLTLAMIVVVAVVFGFLWRTITTDTARHQAMLLELHHRLDHVEQWVFGTQYNGHRYLRCRVEGHPRWVSMGGGEEKCVHCGLIVPERTGPL